MNEPSAARLRQMLALVGVTTTKHDREVTLSYDQLRALLNATPARAIPAQPAEQVGAVVDMILHCPACRLQHIDAPDKRTPDWKNEPHRSHLCHGCGFIWRPADVPTNGVAAIKTKGKADSAAPAQAAPTEARGVDYGYCDGVCDD